MFAFLVSAVRPLLPFAGATTAPQEELSQRVEVVAQLVIEKPKILPELVEGLERLAQVMQKRRALKKLANFTFGNKLESLGIDIHGNRQIIERCFGRYIRGECSRTEEIANQIQDIQADERRIVHLKAKGQWDAAASLKLSLERKLQNLENCELIHQIVLKKGVSKDEAEAWLKKQTFHECRAFIEDKINIGSKMDPVTEFVLGGDLSSLNGNLLVDFLVQNISHGQQLVELYKAQIVALVLKDWLEEKVKDDTSKQIAGLKNEICNLFANWANDIEMLLKTESAKKSEDEVTVQSFKGLKQVLEVLKEKIKSLKADEILEVLQKDLVLLQPSFIQLGNKVQATTQSWVRAKDRDTYNSIAIKILQNPPKLELLCAQFLKNLKEPQAQFSAAKALIQAKQMMVTAEVARNQAAGDLQKR